MAAAAVIAIVTVGGGLLLARGAVAPIAERIGTALRADLFVAAWLVAAIANIARLRFFSPRDIAGSGSADASDPVRTGSAVLQNTLEQTVLAVVAHVGIAATLPHPAPLITALTVLFGVGRAFFWHGYARGAGARAFGFALTFYPTALALLAGIVLTLAASVR